MYKFPIYLTIENVRFISGGSNLECVDITEQHLGFITVENMNGQLIC